MRRCYEPERSSIPDICLNAAEASVLKGAAQAYLSMLGRVHGFSPHIHQPGEPCAIDAAIDRIRRHFAASIGEVEP